MEVLSQKNAFAGTEDKDETTTEVQTEKEGGQNTLLLSRPSCKKSKEEIEERLSGTSAPKENNISSRQHWYALACGASLQSSARLSSFVIATRDGICRCTGATKKGSLLLSVQEPK